MSGDSTVEYVVEVEEVTKRYGEFLAVDDLSFRVPSGVIYGVLGPNGAGKTTTLRMINDILLPDEGSIRLLGNLSPGPAAARRIGYLPEERGLYPKMKVGETLAFFGELRGLARREANRQAKDWLERLAITDWEQNQVQDLSKGMQQKVQFAASLIHDPELLILDEPWSGLDPINADVLKEVVLAQKAAGKTVLFSTHLMEQAEQICDYVCIIAKGKLAIEGVLADLKSEAATEGAVLLEFAPEADLETLEERLRAIDLLSAVKRSERRFDVSLASNRRSEELLSALLQQGLNVQRFECKQPSLHQIFVDRVGEQADTAVADRSRHA